MEGGQGGEVGNYSHLPSRDLGRKRKNKFCMWWRGPVSSLCSRKKETSPSGEGCQVAADKAWRDILTLAQGTRRRGVPRAPQPAPGQMEHAPPPPQDPPSFPVSPPEFVLEDQPVSACPGSVISADKCGMTQSEWVVTDACSEL